MTTQLLKLKKDDFEREEIEESVSPEVFPCHVFDANDCGEQVPPGFNAVKIRLDGGMKADLSWKKEREAAATYTKQGLFIFWELDLGLSEQMRYSLGHATQFLALTLSLEHFCKTLWKEFSKETIGLCLYRGSLDFSKTYFWDEAQILNLQEWVQHLFKEAKVFSEEAAITISEFNQLSPSLLMQTESGVNLLRLFCRDAMGEYLHLLSAHVPIHLPLFLMLDVSEISSLFTAAQLLNRERYPRFHLAVKTPSIDQHLGGCMAWEGNPLEKGSISRFLNKNTSVEQPKIGICMPIECRPSSTKTLKQAFAQLQEDKKTFRVISEENLTMEWEGLDYLIVDPQMMNTPLKRKLQGFCAAGGIVNYVGESELNFILKK